VHIDFFKLLGGTENNDVDCNQFFSPETTCYALRGHDRKLLNMKSRLDTRKFFFAAASRGLRCYCTSLLFLMLAVGTGVTLISINISQFTKSPVSFAT